ncbi:MAG: hypothetical protein MZV64_52670 [Ignavibacteriales bacterium]|nr:hypothetical protein [Ignavibacteriales bacterium]
MEIGARDGRARASRTATSSAIHAIGDRANRETLEPLRGGLQGPPDKKDLRWRDRARPAPRPRRHPALREARRHRRPCRASTARRTRRACSRASGAKRAEEGAYVWQKLMNDRRGRSPTARTPRSRTSTPCASFYATVTRQAEGRLGVLPATRR